MENLQADLAALNPCINEMGCFKMTTYKVDKWSTVTMKNTHYSVPDRLVGQDVSMRIYSEKIVILHQNKKVVVHERIYRPGGWSVKPEHYFQTLMRKPGAISGSPALKQMPEKIQQLFGKHFVKKEKEFVMLLQ